MRNVIISLILLMAPCLSGFAAEGDVVREDAPDRHVVVPGDTLWSISTRFLKDPWKWPEVWRMNQEQIRNPHLIYPGDVIILDRAARQLRLVTGDGAAVPAVPAVPAETAKESRSSETPAAAEGDKPAVTTAPRGTGVVKLSPKVRADSLTDGIPTIPRSAIEPFLSRPLVVSATELDGLPFILATQENRLAIGAGSIAYAERITPKMGRTFQVFRRGEAFVDPDTGELLGYQAVYLGEARLIRPGAQSTLEITHSSQEIYVGDKLIPADRLVSIPSYAPRAPGRSLRGRIISSYGNLGESGPASVVALSRGSSDGLEVGHVLAIYRSQSTARYETRMAPLYGKQGPAANDRLRTYHDEQITARDGPLYARAKPIRPEDAALLPDERYGLVMVFRTFDRASFGFVMQSSRPVVVNDIVTNP